MLFVASRLWHKPFSLSAIFCSIKICLTLLMSFWISSSYILRELFSSPSVWHVPLFQRLPSTDSLLCSDLLICCPVVSPRVLGSPWSMARNPIHICWAILWFSEQLLAPSWTLLLAFVQIEVEDPAIIQYDCPNPKQFRMKIKLLLNVFCDNWMNEPQSCFPGNLTVEIVPSFRWTPPFVSLPGPPLESLHLGGTRRPVCSKIYTPFWLQVV